MKRLFLVLRLLGAVFILGIFSPAGAQVISENLLPVIVNFNVPYSPPATLDAQGLTRQREEIAVRQQQIISLLASFPYRIKRTYEDLPALAVQVDADGLRALLASILVQSVDEDKINAPHLNDSVLMIGGVNLSNIGNTGSGQTVAILDTGVDKNHPALQGKVVSEACYSTTQGSDTTSVCPNGQDSTNLNSGLPCTFTGCEHGTHVAGIAAANGSNPVLQGVAPGANLIAIQVFSRATTQCASYGLQSPCPLAFDSDLAAALQRVAQLAGTYSIASVNMSLGGGTYTAANCQGSGAVSSAISNLASLNVATVASSGNNGSSAGIAWPACLSNVVAVGNSSKQDGISSSSQSGNALDFLAPGSGASTYSPACANAGASICSSLPGNGYLRLSGTSMAAPHVAGTFALLKEASASTTISQNRELLDISGVPLTDSRNGLVRPRVQVDQAMITTRSFNLQPEHCHGEYNPIWTAPPLAPSHYELYKASNSSFANPVLVFRVLQPKSLYLFQQGLICVCVRATRA